MGTEEEMRRSNIAFAEGAGLVRASHVSKLESIGKEDQDDSDWFIRQIPEKGGELTRHDSTREEIQKEIRRRLLKTRDPTSPNSVN